MNGSATPHLMGMKRSAVEKTGGKRMKKAILATKVGMTQIFNADGVLVHVTVLEARSMFSDTDQNCRERWIQCSTGCIC